jgi:hypothetical protein
MSWVSEYIETDRSQIDMKLGIHYHGENREPGWLADPEMVADFAYHIGVAEEKGLLETPTGEVYQGRGKGDWQEIYTFAFPDEERLHLPVQVVTTDFEALEDYLGETDLEPKYEHPVL